MTSLNHNMFNHAERAVRALEGLQPLAQLAARLYVAKVFLLSGLTKVRDWDTTLALFLDEYHVPLLPPQLAAWLGTGAELLLPVFLVLGLGGRIAAFGLFVLNSVAVISLMNVADAALQQHMFWGSLLLALVLWGPGLWSLDAWWAARRARKTA
ncbi:MAG TPA: DoxX family protein [Burkholderiaceae bacterium]|nr:DoxX family protein [Burkholderiaceae bacterium]